LHHIREAIKLLMDVVLAFLNTFKFKSIKHTTQATPQNTTCLSVKKKRRQNKTVLRSRGISSSTNAKLNRVQVDIPANVLYFQALPNKSDIGK